MVCLVNIKKENRAQNNMYTKLMKWNCALIKAAERTDRASLLHIGYVQKIQEFCHEVFLTALPGWVFSNRNLPVAAEEASNEKLPSTSIARLTISTS